MANRHENFLASAINSLITSVEVGFHAIVDDVVEVNVIGEK
ncbi:MAG: hypothetical protein ACI9BO_001242 [Zhongshania sp.]|jgi:hypothetical protein